MEIKNYSAQEYSKLTKKDKDELETELKKGDDTLEAFEARIKEMFPKKVILPYQENKR